MSYYPARRKRPSGGSQKVDGRTGGCLGLNKRGTPIIITPLDHTPPTPPCIVDLHTTSTVQGLERLTWREALGPLVTDAQPINRRERPCTDTKCGNLSSSHFPPPFLFLPIFRIAHPSMPYFFLLARHEKVRSRGFPFRRISPMWYKRLRGQR